MSCDIDPIDWEEDLPEIPDGVATSTVTEGCVDGDGIYDVFMKAHQDAIHQEYSKQRLKGPEYSKVYLGGMQAAMQNAVGFALGKDKAASEAELARYAILKAKYETEAIRLQVCKTEKEIELLQAQREMVAAQTWAEIAKTTPKINTFMKELLGIGTPKNEPVYTGPGDSNTTTVNEESIIGSGIAKTHQEEALLKQKTVSEHSQTHDGPDGPTKEIYKGLALKQRNLAQRQADGFVRNAEAEVAKIRMGTYNIEYSTTDGEGENWIGGDSSLSIAEQNVGDVHSPDRDLEET